MTKLILIALAVFLAGVWLGSGWVWWKIESNLSCRPYQRLYRAITWFPFTVLPAFMWRWLP